MTKLPYGSQIGPYPYRILRQLGEGEGGMSLIYLATTGDPTHRQSGELVAIKIANVETEHRQFYRDTLDNEVEHLRKLRHRGIVRLLPIQGYNLPPNPIYSAQTNLPGQPWFSVMEYLEGGSLAELLKRQGKLEIGLALQIAHKIAETLAFIHQQDHIHLDIKPENIVFRRPLRVGAEPAPVLVDFGIARATGQGGLEAGTLQWSPPERIIHSESKNLPPEMMARPHASMDVYALGLLLYRMVAGRLPFEGSRKSVTSAILEGNPTRPSTYDPALKSIDDLVLSAIAKDPTQRPTAADLAQQLADLAKDHSSYEVPDAGAPEGAAGGRIGRDPWPLLASLAIATLGLLSFIWWGNHDPVEPLSTGTPSVTVRATATRTPRPPPATATPEPPAPSATRPNLITSTPVFTRTPLPTATPRPTQTPAARSSAP